VELNEKVPPTSTKNYSNNNISTNESNSISSTNTNNNKTEYTQDDLKEANELKQKFRQNCIDELAEGNNFEANSLNKLKSLCEKKYYMTNIITGVCSRTNSMSVDAQNDKTKLNQTQIEEHCDSSLKDISFDELKQNRDMLKKLKNDFNSTNLKFKTITIKKVNFTKPTFNLFAKNFKYLKQCVKFYFDSIKSFIEIFKLLLNFNFIFVFINSYNYFKSYLTKIDFDNSCITQYFRLIDAKRYSIGKRTILPFKKSELIKLTYPLQLFVSAYQKAFVKINIIIHVFLLILLVTSLGVDFVLADFLTILRKKLNIKYILKVESEMHLSVCGGGGGMMAKMLSKLSNDKSLNKTEEFDNSACFTNVKATSSEEVKKTIIAFILLSIYILFELYVKRFNKLICTFYFQKWEKKRIIWLYNDLLRKRKSFIQSCKIKVNFKKKTNRLIDTKPKINSSFLNKLFPSYKRCILCDTSHKDDYVECSKCLNIIYCIDCWLDLEEKCVGCVPDYFLFNDNDYDDDSDDDEEEQNEK